MARVVEGSETMLDLYATRRSYDWDTWLDGNVWELVQNEDFDVSVNSFRSMGYQTATRRGIRVRITQREDRIFLQAVLDE
jgi:hypothetical protein